MPIAVTQGNPTTFTVEFYDINGNLTVPSSATLSIIYTNTSGSTASSSIAFAITSNGYVFSATWNTSAVNPGIVTYSVTAPGTVFTPAASGSIRVVN